MWAWYLEWSTIARRAITDRRLLRQLGFLHHSKSEPAVADEATETEVEGDVPSATTPPPSARETEAA